MTQRDRKQIRWGPHLPQLTERRWASESGRVAAQGRRGPDQEVGEKGRKGRRKPTASLSWGDKRARGLERPRCSKQGVSFQDRASERRADQHRMWVTEIRKNFPRGLVALVPYPGLGRVPGPTSQTGNLIIHWVFPKGSSLGGER